jgi:GAF domain-containing protein
MIGRLPDELAMLPKRPPFARSLISELERIARGLELTAGGEALVSVLLVAEDRQRLLHAAAPSLPEPYVWSIDGLPIAQGSGVCGTAAYLGHPVYVADVAGDPLCEAYHAIAREHGLKACWSVPFFGDDGQLLGTVACYYRRRGGPRARDVALVSEAAAALADAVTGARSNTPVAS